MPEFVRKTLPEQHYIFADGESSYQGDAIAEAMGNAFSQVFGFAAANQITPASMPMTVYMEMDPTILRFRGGVMVSEADVARAGGPVQPDVLPAGDVIMTTHVGPYSELNVTHKALWAYMEDNGIKGGMPIWEIYIDDPDTTDESALRTEVYRAIA